MNDYELEQETKKLLKYAKKCKINGVRDIDAIFEEFE